MKPLFNFALVLVFASAYADDHLYEIQTSTYAEWLTLHATVEAVNQSTVSSQISGAIKEIRVDINDRVMAGDIIVELQNQKELATLEEAEANLTQAKAANEDIQLQLNRNKTLFKENSIAKGQLDSIQAQADGAAATIRAAEARVDLAKEQLSYTLIKAPYNGIVVDRMVEVGESVNAGSPVMTGLSLDELRVIADSPQRYIHRIDTSNGIQIVQNEINLTALDVTVFPFANTGSHSFRIRADIANSDNLLLPGMWVKARIPIGQSDSIRIPSTSLLSKGALTQVYVQNEQGPRLRVVRIGRRFDGMIEVLSGLRVNDKIIIDGYAELAKQESN